MQQPLEEVVAGSLDELYAGAVHLCAGDRDEAENLLVAALTEAARVYARERPLDAPLFLATQLVRTHVARAATGDTAVMDSGSAGSSTANVPEPPDLLRRMGTLSAQVRGTLWMVAVLRRPYGEVARALQVDRDQVAAWVREGHRRMLREYGGNADMREHEA